MLCCVTSATAYLNPAPRRNWILWRTVRCSGLHIGTLVTTRRSHSTTPLTQAPTRPTFAGTRYETSPAHPASSSRALTILTPIIVGWAVWLWTATATLLSATASPMALLSIHLYAT